VASPLLAMGGKKEVRTDAPTAVERENSMMMERFAGLELRLDTPKGTSFPCFARCHFPSWFCLFYLMLYFTFWHYCGDLLSSTMITETGLHPEACSRWCTTLGEDAILVVVVQVRVRDNNVRR
jgi:hypothetical protein